MKTAVLCYVTSAIFGGALTLGSLQLVKWPAAMLLGFLGSWAVAGLRDRPPR